VINMNLFQKRSPK